jgi:hypothetical protein
MGFIKKYRIFCITENTWSIGYGTDMPTECYNIAEHTINENSIQHLDSDEYNNHIILEDIQTIGTNGGSISGNIWSKRTLNTITKDSDFLLNLENDEFTLYTGNYNITINAISSTIGKNQIRLYNVTADSAEITGLSNENNMSALTGIINTIENTTFRIEQISNKTQGNIGLGSANGFGIEKYMSLLIKKFI